VVEIEVTVSVLVFWWFWILDFLFHVLSFGVSHIPFPTHLSFFFLHVWEFWILTDIVRCLDVLA
jgi:hypothetical protein